MSSVIIDLLERGRNSTTSKRNCLKCWKGTSLSHFMAMSQICWKLINEYGLDVYTEAEFKSGGRADVVAIKGDTGFIVEVLHSESNKKFNAKLSKYPEEFFISKVNTKDFDIDNWSL